MHTFMMVHGLLNVQLHHPSGILEMQLARQRKLNALSPALVDALQEQVTRASQDPDIRGVMLTAERGRAFCAGGDIMAVEAMAIPDGREFLRREYMLMLSLHDLQRQDKAVIALADGLVLGAGAGLFMSAGTRIASSATSLGMPECMLGIVPDCGGIEFLNSLPSDLGRLACLTGSRLSAGMMATTGLSTHACAADSSVVTALRDRIIHCDVGTLEDVLAPEEAAARTLSEANLPMLEAMSAATTRIFEPASRASADEALVQLSKQLVAEEAAALSRGDERGAKWVQSSLQNLQRACPAALLVTDAASQLSWPADPFERRQLSLGVELAANSALGCRADFTEGVACAVGSKKGQPPQWAHKSIDDATSDSAVQAIIETVRGAMPLEMN